MLRPKEHEQADRLVWGFTPLIAAVASKNLAVVNRLLAAGASVFDERRRDPRAKRKKQTGSSCEENYESTAINYAQVRAYFWYTHVVYVGWVTGWGYRLPSLHLISSSVLTIIWM
jgi:hypothetical protein